MSGLHFRVDVPQSKNITSERRQGMEATFRSIVYHAITLKTIRTICSLFCFIVFTLSTYQVF